MRHTTNIVATARLAGRRTRSSGWLTQFAVSAAITCLMATTAVGESPPDFERDIKPIFRQRCVMCHGQVKQEAGLRLDAGVLIVRGGDSGAVITPHSSSESVLLERVRASDHSERMPPEGKPLAAEQIELLARWIDAGARHPENEVILASPRDHWAFRPVRNVTVPTVKDTAWVRNEIDAFVLAKLEQRSWRPAVTVEPAALLRRVYLDLIGLPPTVSEQQRFAGSPSPAALDGVVDELLSRREYGERWARHWLDVVRYADSNGYERDAEKPFVWRYRDYVIEAFNNDKPFDRFVLEQLAGDELADRSPETNIATGFLRLGNWNDEAADVVADRYDQLDDIVSTTGQAFLGMTIGCARCHDHKFEPIAIRDYYSLLAVFNPLQRPADGRTELTVPVGDDKLPVYMLQESASQPPVTHVLLRGSPTQLGEVVEPAIPAILAAKQPPFPASDEHSTRRRLGLAQWMASADNPLTARVIVNRVWQQHFGQGLVRTANDFGLMGDRPTHPELLDWLSHWFMHDAKWSLKKLHRLILTSSAWRMSKASNPEYAAADPENRWLWHMPYRRLEVEAIRDSMLASSGQLNRQAFGPAMKPRIPAAALEANTDKLSIWQASDEREASRRSIYAFVKRGLVVPMLEVLDLADTVSSCAQRQVTTVAPQALSLFNGEFVNSQAHYFALHLQELAGGDTSRQIELAWRTALCREPTAAELAKVLEFHQREAERLRAEGSAQAGTILPADADRAALVQVCRVLLNLNEFVYPE